MGFQEVKEIAHRGYAGVYPENTLLAFEKATKGERSKPDMIEIDVQPCEDEIIVFHDEKLRKRGQLGLTNKRGVPWKTSSEKVLNAEVLDTGETIPTLDQVLEAVPGDVAINIEIKEVDSEQIEFEWGEGDLHLGEKLSQDRLERNKEIWKPFVEKVLSKIANIENEVIVSSFFEGAIAATRELDSEVSVAFLFWNSIEEGLEVAEKYDCEAIHPPLDMIADSGYFNRETYTNGEFKEIDLIERAHSEGRDVNVWTIENWLQAREMKDAGVDGIITNYPLDIFYSEE